MNVSRAFQCALLLALLTLLSACRDDGVTEATAVRASAAPSAEEVALIDEAGLDFAEKRVADVYDRVSSGVVNITTRVVQPSFFYQAIPQEGAGSGFVLDEEGHILTNYHVIEGARSAEVTFGDETVLPASFVGADPQNDIAVLKVDAPPELLTPVELGTSSTLRVGQRAIAIGNPFGEFGRTLTTGVISASGRRWRLRRLLRDLREPVGLPELARAGVRPDPADLLALLAASVPANRTRGTSAVVSYVLGGAPRAAVAVADGAPLVVLPEPGDIRATAEVHAREDAFLGLLAGTAEAQARGDLQAVERLHRWLRAAQGLLG